MTVYGDDIDLRPFIFALIRNWWKIALLAVLFGSIALGASLIQPRSYAASATILVTSSRPTLSLAQQFPTINQPVDARSRMDALLLIAQDDALALSTFEDIGEKLPEAEREIDALKKKVEVKSQGEAILITASASNPDLAAEIANSWARQTVAAINLAYSGELPLGDIQVQLATAQQVYETSQAELENFMQSSQVNILENRIAEAKILLNNLSGDRSWKITYYMERKQLMEQFISQAEALKQQFESGNTSAAAGVGDAIALLKARASLFGIQNRTPDRLHQSILSMESSENPDSSPTVSRETSPYPSSDISINMDYSELSALSNEPAAYVQDLDVLIAQAEQERTKAEGALQDLTQRVLEDQTQPALQEAALQVQALQTRLENEVARERELKSRRDLNWQAYQALAQKETEIKNAAQTSNQVNLASLAVPPQQPASRGTARNVIVGGLFGLLIGVFATLASQWWKTTLKPTITEGTMPAAKAVDG